MKHTVSGSIKYKRIIGRKVVDCFNNVKKDFDSLEEAEKFAKSLAINNKESYFNVSSETDIIGLTDHHYKFDPYFKMVVQFCHND